MSFGIEVFDENGVKTLGMQDFTYTKIFETTIPAPGNNTSVYNVTVPGFSDSNCVVVFTPLVYDQNGQPGYRDNNGYVPVYKSMGGEVVGVVRRALARYYDASNQRWVDYHTETYASLMEVYRVFGG
ncbi:hypothetical protein [Pseudomonas sp. TTU2014-080ASC]|uniref:hypothetical protein n=1 Tax=Pseudomonas sp. TTU2014-080ASC TaxID=1729724 RepID=UPI0007184622|nr:hypothetical protein [Pseudomonas sp. TTU2014-080ASC]KRW62325.1 hypothetical protein AO726_02570 [Pseudomonas sp. TTU2014-080ASC]